MDKAIFNRARALKVPAESAAVSPPLPLMDADDTQPDELAVAMAQVHYAVEKGDQALLLEVCSRPPPAGSTTGGLDLPDGNGWAALHWCGRYDRPELALALCVAGAARDPRTTVDQHTPLHIAAMGGHVDVVLTLLHFKADVSARDSEGVSALHWAAQGGHAALIPPLLRAAEDAEAAGKSGGGLEGLRDAADSAGRVALHVASAAGHELAAAALMEAGAEPEAPQLRDRRTALHLAAVEGHTGTVECLLGCGAPAGAVDRRGKTALDLAAAAERYPACVLLAEAQGVLCPIPKPLSVVELTDDVIDEPPIEEDQDEQEEQEDAGGIDADLELDA